MVELKGPKGSKEKRVYTKPALKCLELFPQKIMMVQLSARTENYSKDPKHPDNNTESFGEINYDDGWNSKKFDPNANNINW